MKKKVQVPQFGDMPYKEFRKYGHQLVDWIADYLEGIEIFPVYPNINPGDVKSNLSSTPPEKGESIADTIKDFEEKIIPGITHWNHPDFMAYFNSTSSAPGILADLLSSGLNVNGMAWHTCPSATELEELTLNWLKQMLDLPDNFFGIIYDTASVSSMHAIAAAREQLSLEGFKKSEMKIYTSEQAHFSIDKGAIAIGVRRDGIRKIPVDAEFRMIPSQLQRAIEKDKKKGTVPFCVVATVGTTSTTSVDPVKEIAEICNKENIWLHVDAAYAGTSAILPEMRWIFNGIENADSVVVNPHKWMFTPFDLSAFYTRKPEMLKKAFSLSAEYLQSLPGTEITNYMDYGIQLGRRFRSLKLWFIIKYFGVEGIRNRLREHIRLAKMFADWIDKNPDFERVAPAHFGVVCFRAVPKNINNEDELSTLNEQLLKNINSSGKLFLSHTKLNGKYILRICISGIRTLEQHMNLAQELIQRKLNEIIRCN